MLWLCWVVRQKWTANQQTRNTCCGVMLRRVYWSLNNKKLQIALIRAHLVLDFWWWMAPCWGSIASTLVVLCFKTAIPCLIFNPKPFWMVIVTSLSESCPCLKKKYINPLTRSGLRCLCLKKSGADLPHVTRF